MPISMWCLRKTELIKAVREICKRREVVVYVERNDTSQAATLRNHKRNDEIMNN